MIVPCIDLMGGRAVQLVQGRCIALEVDDVLGLVNRFKRYRMLHVIDLDAALGHGSNHALVCQVVAAAKVPVRVGGGVRTISRAYRLLEAGAAQVIVGTRAFRRGRVDRGFLDNLSREVGGRHVMISLDSRAGRIATRGWTEHLDASPEEVVAELTGCCGAFLCTDIDREGTMRGVRRSYFRQLRRATAHRIVAAGGISCMADVRALGRLGMDAAIGMALYSGRLGRAFETR